MNQERWQQIETLYHEALERPLSERATFLRQACSGNVSLLEEVQTLLRDETKAAGFLATPAMYVAAKLLAGNDSLEHVPGTIGRYEIVKRLGGGGMGEVYLGTDLILRRRVAVKILRPEILQNPEARARFLREARAVAALSHSGIVTIYEAGEQESLPYLTMEYLPGQSLRDEIAGAPLDISVVLDYAIQIAAALSHAHEHGILHRDIKSSNVLVTPDRILKLVDFGLARVLEPAPGTELTATGACLGTLQYAAPELLNGRPADQRSDVYSLGVVLYEMTCGELPYGDLTGASLIGAIVRGDAPAVRERNPTVPIALSRLIEQAMSARSGDRYADAGELLNALRALPLEAEGIAAAPITNDTAIAVLDFQNATQDAEIQWLCTGLAETLTADLQKLPSVRIVGRHRVQEALRRQPEGGGDLDIGIATRAQWLISGSFQRVGSRLRIMPRLLHIPTGDLMPLGKVDGNWDDIFELQDRVVMAVIERLPVRMDWDLRERIAVPETLRVEAYEQYALGRKKMLALGKDSLEEARQHFERATTLDSQYAAAWSALGCAHAFRFIRLTDPADLSKSRNFLEYALTLDPELGEPYPFLCYIHLRQNSPDQAIAAGLKAIERQPDLHYSHYYLGATYLIYVDRDPAYWQLAVDHLAAASRVAPGYDTARFLICLIALAVGDYGRVEQVADGMKNLARSGREMRTWFSPSMLTANLRLRQNRSREAREEYVRAFDEMDTGDHVYREPIMALCACGTSEAHIRQGNAEAALAEAHRAWRITTEYPRMLGHERVVTMALIALATAYYRQGDRDRSTKLIEEASGHLRLVMQNPGSYIVGASTPDLIHSSAIAYLRRHEPERATELLEEAVQYGWRDQNWLAVDPELAPIRHTRSVQKLLQTLSNLPPLKWPSLGELSTS